MSFQDSDIFWHRLWQARLGCGTKAASASKGSGFRGLAQFAIENGHRNSWFMLIYPLKLGWFSTMMLVYQRVIVDEYWMNIGWILIDEYCRIELFTCPLLKLSGVGNSSASFVPSTHEGNSGLKTPGRPKLSKLRQVDTGPKVNPNDGTCHLEDRKIRLAKIKCSAKSTVISRNLEAKPVGLVLWCLDLFG